MKAQWVVLPGGSSWGWSLRSLALCLDIITSPYISDDELDIGVYVRTVSSKSPKSAPTDWREDLIARQVVAAILGPGALFVNTANRIENMVPTPPSPGYLAGHRTAFTNKALLLLLLIWSLFSVVFFFWRLLIYILFFLRVDKRLYRLKFAVILHPQTVANVRSR